MSESLIEQIKTIDKQALEMAMIAAQHPALRQRLAESVKLLKERLLEAAAELRDVSPDDYRSCSEQILDILLDLNFAETETNKVSHRMALFLELERIASQKTVEKYDKPFPLPDNVQNLTNTLKTDMINFQTTLTLEDIAKFYRSAFAEQGLSERKLFANFGPEYITLIFEGLPSDRIILVSAVDLAYSMNQDLRNVNIKTEEDSWKNP
jgi:hypothetical protein